MITASNALTWLNQFDKSHLNGTNQQLLGIAANQRTAIKALENIAIAVSEQAKTSPHDGLDYPESLLNCAVIEHNRGLYQQASENAYQAAKLYKNAHDLHGHAMALWILGIAEFSLRNVAVGYENWKNAWKIIDDLKHNTKHIPDTRDWYIRVLKLMGRDLVMIPDESCSWLNHFSLSRISESNVKLLKLMNERIERKQYAAASSIITALREVVKSCLDFHESAEILAQTGLAEYLMGNYKKAMLDLCAAVAKFNPSSHHQEVARWMLGAIQWSIPEQRFEAIKNWEMSIKGFQALAEQADRKNLQSQKLWYREKNAYMQAALKEKKLTDLA
jgi:tetratricopeptide (TPR) repeat protein